MNILIFLIILLVLVLVHEFGHFFTAKKFGIRVDEFGFGFPPKLFGKKYGETEYSFNLLPLGGFVKIFGENPDDENTNGPDRERSFVHKAKWKQAIVLSAGVIMNFLLAWLLFSIGFMSGLPTSVGSEPTGYKLSDVSLTVVSVLEKSPAELAGLKSGDKIVSVTHAHNDGEMHSVTNINPDTLKSFVMEHGSGDEIDIGYIRGKDSETTAKVMVNKTDGESSIGISMDMIGMAKLPFFTALIEGMRLNWFVTKGTVVGLYTLLADSRS